MDTSHTCIHVHTYTTHTQICRHIHAYTNTLTICKIDNNKKNIQYNPTAPFILVALHKTLAHYIQPLTQSDIRIRDSKHMIQILHDNPHLTHSYYCSFDIKSLYKSCSMQLAKRTVIEHFSREPSLLPAHFSITALDTLISFCLDL